jgi:hypothetical protein
MLVPSSGFIGERVDKSGNYARPKMKGSIKTYFSQRWPEESKIIDPVIFSNGIINSRYAKNAQLCTMNRGERGAGFRVCSICGAAATEGTRPKHRDNCNGKTFAYFNSIGTSFTSDILELSFIFKKDVYFDENDWESLMWALYTASTIILEIPESEIGGTCYATQSEDYAILLYDNVPGGAGHAFELTEKIHAVVSKAYEIVSTCTCNEDSCCYGCLCNYFNQQIQNKISRGGALRILEALL